MFPAIIGIIGIVLFFLRFIASSAALHFFKDYPLSGGSVLAVSMFMLL
jgi:hypothetical protein